MITSSKFLRTVFLDLIKRTNQQGWYTVLPDMYLYLIYSVWSTHKFKHVYKIWLSLLENTREICIPVSFINQQSLSPWSSQLFSCFQIHKAVWIRKTSATKDGFSSEIRRMVANSRPYESIFLFSCIDVKDPRGITNIKWLKKSCKMTSF